MLQVLHEVELGQEQILREIIRLHERMLRLEITKEILLRLHECKEEIVLHERKEGIVLHERKEEIALHVCKEVLQVGREVRQVQVEQEVQQVQVEQEVQQVQVEDLLLVEGRVQHERREEISFKKDR